ncbi:hypothetical protein [Burkholderia latens]|uniref:hypothetical protein n=1 Tax=Burkholderia latens TaxID=488446 RepID=UPI0012E3D5AF|nr:hypothetical protein [Burkholderia latens]
MDISRRHRLVTLWISTVSVCIRPGQQTGRGVDIRRRTRLETLCVRMVSMLASCPQPRHCGHPAPSTNRNAVHFTGEDGRVSPPEPLSRGPRAPAAALSICVRRIAAFSKQRARSSRNTPNSARDLARKISQFRRKTCAVFLTTRRPEQDEKKLSRVAAKK